MATPYKYSLSPAKAPGTIGSDYISPEAAHKVSELLNLNNELFHVYFHFAGMHNHILHHLLAIYPMGASPEELQSAYDHNEDFQKPSRDVQFSKLVADFSNPDIFAEHLGKPEYYEEYLKFFKGQIATNGYERILNDFVFAGGTRADDFFARMFGGRLDVSAKSAGLLHPIIHLGYGLEFRQPCAIAEALASAAIHDTFMGDICFPCEQLVSRRERTPKITMMALVDRLHGDSAIRDAISEEETHNKLATDLVPRQGKRLFEIISTYTVSPDELEQKVSEMVQVNCTILATAQMPGKDIAIDFYLMHCTNLAVFYPIFLQQEWLSVENKCRLLEWKVWLDLAVYASCKAPTLYLDRLLHYSPNHPGGGWNSIFLRARRYRDDGHTAKLIRAIKLGEIEAAKFPNLPGTILQKQHYILLAHMVLDYVEKMDAPDYVRPEVVYFEDTSEEILRLVARWIRFCGTKIAWKDVPDLNTSPNGSDKIHVNL